MKLEVLELEERLGQQVTPLPKDKYPSLLTCVVSIFTYCIFVMTSAAHEYETCKIDDHACYSMHKLTLKN